MIKNPLSKIAGLVYPIMLAIPVYHWYQQDWNITITVVECGYIVLALFGALGMYIKFVGN